MNIVCILLVLYTLVLLVRVFSTWFPAPSYGSPLRRVMEIVYALTEPVLRPLRRVLPPLRMGMVGLDLSPIIAFVVLVVLRQIFC
jgi:YggT family protein